MEKIVKAVNFPKDLVDEVVRYQKENYIASFTAAVVELVRKGLTK
ncbi:hypothetical protein [Bacillus subtilis]